MITGTAWAMAVMALGAMLLSGLALAQEKPFDLPEDLRRDMGEEIRKWGYECPDVRAVFFVRQDQYGANLRVVCGAVSGPPNPALQFRVTAISSGAGRIMPWR